MTDTETALISRCMELAGRGGVGPAPVPVGLDGVTVICARKPLELGPTLYHPMICLVLQGAKEIIHRHEPIRFVAGEIAIVSHELISHARIVSATPAAPYVAMACEIDLELLRSFHAEIELNAIETARADAVSSGAANRMIVDAMARLLDLIDKPLEQRVLLPLVQRELHFRVLLSHHSRMLRLLSRTDSHASRIARAIAHIRAHWASPIRTGELAKIANMSPSSFHEHFKAMTSTTPIQYQKSLRLFEAHRRLIQSSDPISAVAFSVGYESVTQFSREYRRIYGASPQGERNRVSLSDVPQADIQKDQPPILTATNTII